MYPCFLLGNTHISPNTLLVENDEKRVGEHVGLCGGNMGEYFPFHIKNMFIWR